STACVSALGSSVIDLAELARAGLLGAPGAPEGELQDVFEDESLNRFLAHGPAAWRGVRAALGRLRRTGPPGPPPALVARRAVELLAPVAVGDFVDFSASLHHATRVGRLLRPGLDPLPAQWRRMPVGYHGRAGSVVVSGTDVVRPLGQVVLA